jgi:hypothetical protein
MFFVGTGVWWIALLSWYIPGFPRGSLQTSPTAWWVGFIGVCALLLLPFGVWRVGQTFLHSRKIKILPLWLDTFAAALGTVLLYGFGGAALTLRVLPGFSYFWMFVLGATVGIIVLWAEGRERR